MIRILIAGGGGFGLELHGYIAADIAAGRLPDHELAGVLNDGEDCELLRKVPGTPYLGSIADYQPLPGDAVVIAQGSVAGRHKIGALMRERGARLLTYVHPSAWVSTSATLGEGVLVCPGSIVNAGAEVQDNVAINVLCSVGHGARIGPDSVLSPYCALSGDSELGACGFMGTRATLFPKVVLGRDCIVDAHSAVKQSTPDNKIISVRGQYLVLDNRLRPSR
jgi:UDP-3-O-[3-hydroxymyristoyl] glucosamine N-acyltransferase